jgi:DnaJ homolog subfamily A member 2
MPLHGRALMKGHLLWNSTSSSHFPEFGALSRLTNAGHSSIRHEVDQCEETVMHDVNIEEMRRMKHQRRQEAYDKDEESTVKEDAGPRPRVRCAQHSS